MSVLVFGCLPFSPSHGPVYPTSRDGPHGKRGALYPTRPQFWQSSARGRLCQAGQPPLPSPGCALADTPGTPLRAQREGWELWTHLLPAFLPELDPARRQGSWDVRTTPGIPVFRGKVLPAPSAWRWWSSESLLLARGNNLTGVHSSIHNHYLWVGEKRMISIFSIAVVPKCSAVTHILLLYSGQKKKSFGFCLKVPRQTKTLPLCLCLR